MAGQQAESLSYSEVGATRSDLPPGYAHDRQMVDLGPFDPETFRRAAAALRSWQVQAAAGMTVVPDAPVEDGATFALLFRLPLGYVTAAGRVVYVVDQPDRCGFAYGTLPGHPEQGEEAFAVVRHGDRLCLEIVAFSRPRHPLARLGRPVSRLVQRHVTRRYIAAMRTATAQPASQSAG